MKHFVCPVCGEKLIKYEKSLVCSKKHSFDISKEGYVNLFIPKKNSSGNHGDDKLMVRARRDFLNKGYYSPLMQQVCDFVCRYTKSGDVVLDAGCGECWYTSNIQQALETAEIQADIIGVDISKNALAAGAKRNKKLQLAVASVFNIPVENESCQILLNLFAPYSKEETLRVLKKDGIMILVIPLENHLWGLKKAVYPKPYKNEVKSWELDGFTMLEKQEIRSIIHLPCSEDIKNLFAMTPYYYKTGADDQKRLESLTELDTETEFAVIAYRKNI
ncbi:MAG: methyltransferase domain-containing protein [Oscillospiraceae bacterium]|nr:methyltransferase domain-containing protein [Oscillospiraceae bacterium]